jgi:hypothetical protein
MANTLAGNSLAAIAANTLDVLLDVNPPLRAFTTDFSPDVATEGSSVTTRVVTALTSGSLASGYSASAQNVTLTAKTITLGEVTGFVIGFTDSEWSKSSINLQDIFIRPGVQAVSNDMIDDALALVTNANFGAAAFTGAAATFDADDAADLAQTLSTAKVPKMDRFLLVGPTYYAALAKDNAIQASYAYGGAEAIRENRVPRVHGMDVIEYTDIPANGENLVGLCGAPQGIIIAARTPAVPDSFPGEIANVTDPDSGFTIQLRKWYSADDGKHYLSMGAMWGVAVGVAGNLKRLVSA